MTRLIIASLALFHQCIITSALAGGSFSIEDLLPLLRQNKDLHDHLTRTLDIEAIGTALRIGTMVNKDLGGARIAPYTIRAKPKGSPGPWVFYLEIDAETVFLDANGKPVPLEEGKEIQEKLLGIKLTSIPEEERD